MKLKIDKIKLILEYHEAKEIVDNLRIHEPKCPVLWTIFHNLESLIYGKSEVKKE